MNPDEEIPCVAQIPVTYGDTGEPLTTDLMLQIHKALVRQFQGYTPLGTIRGGVWADPETGREVIEDQMRIEVWVPPSRLAAFKTLVRAIGHETRQKQMFVIIPEAKVDRLDIRDADAGGLLF